MKLYIDDIVKIGPYAHLGPLQGVVCKIVSEVFPRKKLPYQVLNLRRCDTGERLVSVDGRVLGRV